VSPALAQQAVKRFIRLGTPVFCGGGNGPYVALTFDDGPGLLTPRLLQVLRAARIPATFFLIGRNVVLAPKLVRRELLLGEVGDHTWSHPALPKLDADPTAIARELGSTRAAIHKITRRPVLLMRPPFGQRDQVVDGVVNQMGFLDVEWSVGGDDKGVDATTVYNTLVSRVQAGSIILLHENVPGEIEGLQQFLPVLAQRGLIPVTVPELLALDPPDPANMPNNQGQCVAH
jgi:peptidoglycan/xylan/chitin deacetylase (PgdA/CDA1 family)